VEEKIETVELGVLSFELPSFKVRTPSIHRNPVWLSCGVLVKHMAEEHILKMLTSHSSVRPDGVIVCEVV
jgi:hypothetical protein